MHTLRYIFHSLVIGVGLLIGVSTYSVQQTSNQLDAIGILFQARIDDKHHETGRFEHFIIQYTYTPPGQAYQYTVTEEVSDVLFSSVQVGDITHIRYLPNDIRVSKIEHNEPNIAPGEFMAFIFVLIGIMNIRKTYRERHTRYWGGKTVSQASIDYFTKHRRR